MIPSKYKKKVAEQVKEQWLSRESDVSAFVGVLKENFGNINGLSVLDAGCAQGRDSAELAKRGVVVTGIDNNETFLSEAKNLYSEI